MIASAAAMASHAPSVAAGRQVDADPRRVRDERLTPSDPKTTSVDERHYENQSLMRAMNSSALAPIAAMVRLRIWRAIVFAGCAIVEIVGESRWHHRAPGLCGPVVQKETECPSTHRSGSPASTRFLTQDSTETSSSTWQSSVAALRA
jgi:hypothetical protein